LRIVCGMSVIIVIIVIVMIIVLTATVNFILMPVLSSAGDPDSVCRALVVETLSRSEALLGPHMADVIGALRDADKVRAES
jgi:hypothetical protein